MIYQLWIWVQLNQEHTVCTQVFYTYIYLQHVIPPTFVCVWQLLYSEMHSVLILHITGPHTRLTPCQQQYCPISVKTTEQNQYIYSQMCYLMDALYYDDLTQMVKTSSWNYFQESFTKYYYHDNYNYTVYIDS